MCDGWHGLDGSLNHLTVRAPQGSTNKNIFQKLYVCPSGASLKNIHFLIYLYIGYIM